MNQILPEFEADQSTETGATPTTQKLFWFTPSSTKFVLISICTFGIYELYWFYKNWMLIKGRTNQNLMPFWRALFAPLWAYSCFKHIKSSAGENGVPTRLSIGLLAFAYFALQATSRLPDPYWLISLLSFVPLMPANAMALKVNKIIATKGYENATLTGWNWAGIVVGGSLIVLAIIGSLLPKG